ncbi:MAG: DUF4317 family protein [Treponema sp.]|nr:DUF4317 family protein [Candidatus Treponema equifaecale]
MKKTRQINREDMLLLTRRMNLERTSITRVAGCYVDADGDFDGSFNVNFLKLTNTERGKNLKIAKTIPFAETNKELISFEISKEKRKSGGVWDILMNLRECGLKNDALMDMFYDVIMEKYHPGFPYAIMLFHDCYDIPLKGQDKIRLGESEMVFEYIIGAICPLEGEYEPGLPEFGFIFPAFIEGGAALNYMQIYQEAGVQRDNLLNLFV